MGNHLPRPRDDPHVTLTGVCRLGAHELERVRVAFEIPFATEDHDEPLDRGGMDALVIASPHALHGAQALAALRLGLHVMVEKPMTLDLEESRTIEAEAAARGWWCWCRMDGTSSRSWPTRRRCWRPGAWAGSAMWPRR